MQTATANPVSETAPCDKATALLNSNNICYVYPNGEVLVSAKYTPTELANISGVIHQYTLLQKLKRYQQKLSTTQALKAQARKRSV